MWHYLKTLLVRLRISRQRWLISRVQDRAKAREKCYWCGSPMEINLWRYYHTTKVTCVNCGEEYMGARNLTYAEEMRAKVARGQCNV